MNKTEAEFAQLLEQQKASGEILWYRFEGITLKLANDTRYTPDFFVMTKDYSLGCIEIKGFWQDDAKVKIKVAAAMFPFSFTAVKKKTKKDGGGWERVEF